MLGVMLIYMAFHYYIFDLRWGRKLGISVGGGVSSFPPFPSSVLNPEYDGNMVDMCVCPFSFRSDSVHTYTKEVQKQVAVKLNTDKEKLGMQFDRASMIEIQASFKESRRQVKLRSMTIGE